MKPPTLTLLILSILCFGCDQEGAQEPVPDTGGVDDTASALDDAYTGSDTEDRSDGQTTENDSTGGLAQGTSCDGDSEAAALIESLVGLIVSDTRWVFTNTHGSERGYALGVLGDEAVRLGSAVLFEPCNGPVDFDPYCEPTPEGWSVCLRMGCEEASVGYAEVWYGSEDLSDPAENMPFAVHSTGTLDATVTYDPGPYRYWRSDLRTSTSELTVAIENGVTVELSDGETLDLSHVGTVTALGNDGDPFTLDIQLTFTGFQDDVAVVLSFGTDSHGTGTVTSGERVLADFLWDDSVTDPAEAFQWVEGCEM